MAMDPDGDPKHAVAGYPAAAAANAYAYHAPPHYGAAYPSPPPHDGAFYANRPYDHGPSPILRRFVFVSLAGFVLVAAAVTLISWLVVRPIAPEISVSSFSVSAFNLSASTFSPGFDLALSIRNPNGKVDASYGDAYVTLLYGSEVIAQTLLPRFDQDEKETTPVRAELTARAEDVDGAVAKGIAADRTDHGAVEFHVGYDGWVSFQSGAWRSRRHVMSVFCPDIRVGFQNATSSVGSVVGPPKKCMVTLSSTYNSA